jgi:hypothetical protein
MIEVPKYLFIFSGKIPWMLRLYHGRWQKGVSAGGCRNNTGT